MENPFLLERIGSTQMKPESDRPLSMLFEDTSTPKEEVVEEEDPQMATTWDMEEEILPTKSPMSQIYRTMSPSPRPEISSLWDPSHESLMETEPEQTHSSLNILDT